MPRTIHDCSTRFYRTPEYMSWDCMVQRCTNPHNRAYKNYGGRGIKVCKAWRTFTNFIRDMGKKPDGFVLDRKDNSKGYSPKNCRWASRAVSNMNTRKNVFVTYCGVRLHLAEWARRIGIGSNTFKWRLQHWTLKEAIRGKE